MKIAVPTREGYIEDHLSCCESYTIYTVDEGYNIVERETFETGAASCCVDNPVARLRRTGVSVILAGRVEQRLYSRMTGFGLEVFRNYHGEADQVVKHFLEGLTAKTCDPLDLSVNGRHIEN